MGQKYRLDKIISIRLAAPLYAQLESIAADLSLPVAEVARAALATVALNRALGAQTPEG